MKFVYPYMKFVYLYSLTNTMFAQDFTVKKSRGKFQTELYSYIKTIIHVDEKHFNSQSFQIHIKIYRTSKTILNSLNSMN